MTRILSAWRILAALLVGALLLPAVAVAAEQVTVERDTPLYAEPRVESQQVAQLKQGVTGEVVGKSGAWLNLKTQSATGWVFSFNVRFPSSAQTAEGGSTLGRVFAPRRPNVGVTSTIGIRGLDKEDLRQASFSPDQMRQLEQYAASRETAQSQARDSGLAPARVDYLGGRP
jgi:hypothetical protein